MIKKIFHFILIKIVLKFKLLNIDESIQNSNFNFIGLDRDAGLGYLKKVLKDQLNVFYNENDGMFSEHLVILSSLSIKNPGIKSILEIGTFDGKTSYLLSYLFPNALIDTIDLPTGDIKFSENYNRVNQVDNFTHSRSKLISARKNIFFKELNSIYLTNETKQYDLIFVDGAHGYPIVAMDIVNAYRLCKNNGTVLIDDVYKEVSNEDPIYQSVGAFQSLSSLCESGILKEFHLIPKRLNGQYNLPWEKKYVAIFKK
jgi:predicted O-methyltransferase YrrM